MSLQGIMSRVILNPIFFKTVLKLRRFLKTEDANAEGEDLRIVKVMLFLMSFCASVVFFLPLLLVALSFMAQGDTEMEWCQDGPLYDGDPHSDITWILDYFQF